MVESNLSPFTDNVMRAVTSAARKAESVHRNYVDFDDLQSEGYIWIASHAEDVGALVESGKDGAAMLHSSIYRHMHKFAMKQRYLKDGTKPGDYFLYSTAVIAELMPEVLDGPDACDASPSDLNGQIRANKPVNERGDRAAMVADIQKAVKTLAEEDVALLREKFENGGVTEEVIAIAYGITQQAVNYRLTRVLKRISEWLGGEPFVGRRAISNARAQQETRQQEWQ